MKPVNPQRPVRFYDDRCKTKDYVFLKQVLFEDDEVCLGLVEQEEGWPESPYVLFRKKSGRVIGSEDLEFWYAENCTAQERELVRSWT